MSHFWNAALLSAALIVPMAFAPAVLRADDHDRKEDARRYHDKKHNDDHQWGDHEDQAYRKWAQERHRKYSEFYRIKDRDQQAYWQWRHGHSDALLKIEIR